MKILVYGAGVQGSVYAARLQHAGHEITVLARGQRLEEIRQHGIVLRELPNGDALSTRMHTVEQLAPGDNYDLVMVAVRRSQLQDLLPKLANNSHVETFLFFLNNAAGFDEITRLVGQSRVIAGFPTVGGSREGHVIRYTLIPQQPTTLGELDGKITERLRRIRQVMEQGGFPVVLSRHIDAWLKTHVAFILAITGTLYLARGDNYKLAEMPEGIPRMVRAVREGFRALQAQGIPITPLKLRALFLWLPPSVAIMYWKRYLGSERGEYTMARHARVASDEMKELANEWRDLQCASSVKTPVLDELCLLIDRY